MSPSQARAARRLRRQRRRRLVRFAGFGVVVVIAVVFIAALILPSLPIGLGSRSAPDGPGDKVTSQGRTHIVPGQDHPSYNSIPATSGWHYNLPLAPVKWGVHDEFVADESLLHNLEHGGIGIHYDCPDGCDELIDQLTEIVDRAETEGLKVLLSPYPGMDTAVALTAWTFIDKLDGFDGDRIRAFINSHESSPNAPEPNAR